MRSVAELAGEAALRQDTDAETWSRGMEMARRVRLSARGPYRISATVEGDDTAEVVLTGSADGLGWACSAGDASPVLICPHVVAVALQVRRRAPGSRS